jgi:protease IV
MSEAPPPPYGSPEPPYGSTPSNPAGPSFASPPPVPPAPPFGGPSAAPPGPPPVPPRFFYPPPEPPRSSGGTTLLGCGLALSVVLNIAALGIFLLMCLLSSMTTSAGAVDAESNVSLPEVRYSGKTESSNKIAIVSLDGVIMEGLLNFVHHQIDQAVRDKQVRAVVLRINSPGGSITASDDLYNRLVKLDQGDPEKKTSAKPLVVSMGSMAASGGYYVAMPARSIFAERTTMTGSIGVYASFPDVAGLARKYEFGMRTIKQGEIKDSGSPFKDMTPKEVQVWQDMVDHSYDEFLDVVVQGRKDKLTKADLLAPVTVKPVNAGPKRPEKEEAKPYQRYRADGGVWTADKALELKLIDHIGTLDDAVAAARDAAELGKDYKAIRYEKIRTFSERLLGIQAPESASLLEPARLRAGLTPRLWYLAPGSEVAGILAAAEAK